MKFYLSILLYFAFTGLLSAQTSHFAKSGDIPIHYQTVGEGYPVLIINGGPGFNSEGFLPLAKKIAALGYQSILFDQRGTGKSKVANLNSSTITIDLMAIDIEAIRKDMGIEKWIVLGHSFGGMLANYYASKYPSVISAMIQSSSGGVDLHLMNSFRESLHARLSSTEIDSMNYWRQQYIQSNDIADRIKLNHYLAKAYVFHEEHRPIVANRLMQGNMDINQMVWQDMNRIAFDCKDSLKHFSPPVLIIQGKEDVVPEELAERAHAVYEHSDVVILNECGHYGWLDQEKKYISSIREFLNSVPL